MRPIYTKLLTGLIVILSACSTTKRLPEGAMLYTGVSSIEQVAPPSGEINHEAQSQVLKALEAAPNNSFFGSAYHRIPFPFGLWMYNLFYTERQRGFKHWLLEKLGSTPITIEDVDAPLRSSVAETLLDDNGYFNGSVDYKIIPSKKNKKKAKISYVVNYNTPYHYDSIEFIYPGNPSDSIIRAISDQSVLKKGALFNVNRLEEERTRISTYLRNNGYYYFRPDFISYVADSMGGNHSIALRMLYKPGIPESMLKPWVIGEIDYLITNTDGLAPTDTADFHGMGIFYRGKKQPVRSRALHQSLAIEPGQLFSQQKVDQTQSKIARLNTFRYAEMRYMPRDTVLAIDSLNVLIDTALDLPIDGEIEMNITSKSNDQTGPGVIFGITKRNFFRGGEVFNTQLRGSYEWYTGGGSQNTSGNQLINSYEFGVKTSITFPRLVAPRFMHRDRDFQATSTVKLDASLVSRAGFFRMLSITGEGSYDFHSSKTSTHTLAPFGLTYSFLLNQTTAFDSIMTTNKALALSFENQFIPYISYKYTFDNSVIPSVRNPIWWQSSIKQAGSIVYGAMELFGNKQGNDKTIFGNPFSQFVRVDTDFRYYYRIKGKHIIASRLYGGVVKAFLNSEVAPYGEQFYIGGANSLRAFQVRSIGPGSYVPDKNALYSYLDQTGDIKLEANVEYRFPIYGDLNGAVFLDAGNVWKFKPEDATGRGDESFDDFGRQVALGTGTGLRYDITYLVFRFDVGIPLHIPYATGKAQYYNVTRPFFKSFAYHFAIGYPF